MKKYLFLVVFCLFVLSCDKKNKVESAVTAIPLEVKVERLLRENGAHTVVIRKDYTVFAVTGQREETEALIKVLEPYGLIEFVRSGRVAILKGSSDFHDRLKEFEKQEPGEDVVENEFLSENEKVFSM